MNKSYDVYMCREPNIKSLVGMHKRELCKKFLIRCKLYADIIGKRAVVVTDTSTGVVVSAYYE